MPRKNPEYLLRVLAETDLVTCRALIAGRPFTADIERWIKRLDVDERVDFLGWCGGARLERFFASIDVLLVPSSYEPSGLVAIEIEASLRGIPVICTRVDGLEESMGEHAFFADDDNYPSVLAAVRAWRSADQWRVTAQAEAARQRAAAMFTAPVMAERYLRLYDEIATETDVSMRTDDGATSDDLTEAPSHVSTEGMTPSPPN